MTAVTADRSPVDAAPARVRAAIRMGTVNWGRRFGMAWLILAVVFVLHQTIWWVVRSNGGDVETGYTGALTSFFFILGSTYLALMTQVMPFALSLGITRRHFYLGTVLLVAAETLVSAIGLSVLLAVERATAGWGLRVQFFEMGFMGQSNPATQVLAYWVPLLTLSLVFVLLGAVFRRWGQLGIWCVVLVPVVLAAAGVMVLTWQDAWGAFGRFFVETPTSVLLAGYPLILAAVAAGAGYLVLRRATP